MRADTMPISRKRKGISKGSLPAKNDSIRCRDCHVETALDWVKRSREIIAATSAALDRSPMAAADKFLCRHRSALPQNRRYCSPGHSKSLSKENKKSDGSAGRELDLQLWHSTTGTGIRFMDELLKHHYADTASPVLNINDLHLSIIDYRRKGICLEVEGKRETGKTTLLITLAASYLAATMSNKDNQCTEELEQEGIEAHEVRTPDESSRHGVRHAAYCFPQNTAMNIAPPPVIVLDCDNGIHNTKVVCATRAAIIRRQEFDSNCHSDKQLAVENNELDADTMETAVNFNLGRLNICHPRDEIDMICILEQIRHAMDVANDRECLSPSLGEGARTKLKNEDNLDFRNYLCSAPASPSSAPWMVIIDSINSFEQRDRMLPEGGGLSAHADVMRQLQRLVTSHPDIVLVISKMIWYNIGPGGGGAISQLRNGEVNSGSSGGHRRALFQNGAHGGCDNKDSMATIGLTLDRSLPGTIEFNQGFNFVALSGNALSQSNVAPFSINSSGIVC